MFTYDKPSHKDLTQFVQRAIDRLNDKINLYVDDVLENGQFERLCSSIRNNNVLIVDDITTSGSTLNEIMRALRLINENNKITIFSLIGRKDLLVEQ